ncbi:MAG: helix-turn-helix domain-containing protein [Deltaproteobacteria bacterium]|nr:helix-turn-helix domain-containing protein [Deltaproteobacteria bacterium]
MIDSPFIPTPEAARYLGGLSPRTLEKLRLTGGGPPFYKFGRRVLYRLEDLEIWAGSRCHRSTSDQHGA